MTVAYTSKHGKLEMVPSYEGTRNRVRDQYDQATMSEIRFADGTNC